MQRSRLSRAQKITNYLLRGNTINGRQALIRFGIYRLSAVIFNLRKKGFVIDTNMVKRNGYTYAVYNLKETPSV